MTATMIAAMISSDSSLSADHSGITAKGDGEKEEGLESRLEMMVISKRE